MPKRKLSELDRPARSAGSKNRKMSMQATRLTNKFDQGVQLIARALKTARGFERQKLSRREKTAKAEGGGGATTLARLAEEVEALKELDYHVTAERYLFKQLSKTKRIAETVAFNEFKEDKTISTEGPRNTAESNVLARLFKSNPVKNVLPDIMAGIRKLLGLDDMPSGKNNNNSESAKDASRNEKSAWQIQSQREEVDASQSESEAEERAVRKDERSQLHDAHGEEGSGRDEDSVVADGDGSESDEFAQFDALIAPGSDSENSEAESEPEGISRTPALAADDISDSVSRSPSPSFSIADSPPPPPSKKTKGDKDSSKTPAKDTTFLPSLMMGGYWSGSESEATDDEAAASGPPRRKNRMGQQARRALWEKKYGVKANHVQNEQKKQKHSRDSGWDTKRGATTDGGGRGRGGKYGGGGRGGGFGRPQGGRGGAHSSGPSSASGANLVAAKGKRASQDTGPLHPSWEAKRRAKEQAATASFQGKKVVFD